MVVSPNSKFGPAENTNAGGETKKITVRNDSFLRCLLVMCSDYLDPVGGQDCKIRPASFHIFKSENPGILVMISVNQGIF